MATFWKRTAHSVKRMFSIVILVFFSYFGFEGGTLVLTPSVPGCCLSFNFFQK